MILQALGFIACATAIVWAGTRLTHYADIIAERTGMGHVWAGTLLLATATSLPELFNGVSAGVQGLPDIAVGCVAGSNVINLVILGCLDWVSRERTCLQGLHRFHGRTALYAIIMSGLAIAGLLLGDRLPALLSVSPIAFLIVALYIILMRGTGGAAEGRAAAVPRPGLSLRAALARFGFFALVVVCAAILLPGFSTRLAGATGLGDTLVGNTLVAFVTSLPELVTAVAAVRIGAADMAAGGMIGSNIFNLTILGVADFAHWRGSLFTGARSENAIPLLAGILLAVLFVVVRRHCPRRRFLRLT
ncbi:MAG: sodium:calcium antiporter, partial [bacterium]